VSRPRPDAGFSIVLAVMTILILLVLGLAMASMVTEDSDLALNHVQSNQAFYAAHAGVEYAVLKLSANWGWTGLAPPGKNVGVGSFWIAPPDTLDETGTPLPAGEKRIVSTGVAGSAVRAIQVHVTSGSMALVAGTGSPGYGGDGGPATSAQLKTPKGVAVDGNGNVYIADTQNNVVRRVDALTGVITTVAGTGSSGSSGNGGLATSARLSSPQDVAVAPNGDLYIADTGNSEIRKVTAATGVITLYAGTGSSGSTGDGGAATSAKLNGPSGVSLDGSGNVYIADAGNNEIRKVTAATGVITRVAGTGSQGSTGDGGPATSARLKSPYDVAVASNGDFYIADQGNNEIRMVTAATGVITTYAGTGSPGSSGDGGPATSAQLQHPEAVALASNGDLYIADTQNNVIRRITAGSGIITTVVGTGAPGSGGDGGPATLAQLKAPEGVAISTTGDIYIADSGNNEVRRAKGALGVVAWVETRT
jgi:sugar lactone lactonase YvrE